MALPEGKHELTLHRRAEDRRFTVLISFIITIWPAESRKCTAVQKTCKCLDSAASEMEHVFHIEERPVIAFCLPVLGAEVRWQNLLMSKPGNRAGRGAEENCMGTSRLSIGGDFGRPAFIIWGWV